MAPRLHGVDQELVAAVEAKHYELQKSSSCVEAQPKLTCWIVLVQVADEQGVLRRVDSVLGFDSVFASRVVDFHAT